MSPVLVYIKNKANKTGDFFMEMKSAELIRKFVDEVLSGDWEKFETFDVRSLSSSEEYGCPGRNFDCDDSELMRAVYVVLWGDFFPGLTMENYGYRKQYRGDTVNTFHSMFGRPVPGKPGFFAGVEKYAPSDDFREKVRSFFRQYSSVGNYVVLPNYYARQTTLNCYRGTNEWRDFFDRFLIGLRKVLLHAPDADETLAELVKVNDFCFSKFKTEEAFSSLIQTLLLDDYCENGVPQVIFPLNYHWKDEKNQEQYLHDAELYLEKSHFIITKRSRKIVQLLKEKTAVL